MKRKPSFFDLIKERISSWNARYGVTNFLKQILWALYPERLAKAEAETRVADIFSASAIVASYLVGMCLVCGWSFLHKVLQMAGINFLAIDSDAITLSIEYISYGIIVLNTELYSFWLQLIGIIIGIVLIFSRVRKNVIVKVFGWSSLIFSLLSAFPYALRVGEAHGEKHFNDMFQSGEHLFPRVELELKSDVAGVGAKLNLSCPLRVFMDKKHIYLVDLLDKGSLNGQKIYMINTENLVFTTIRQELASASCSKSEKNPFHQALQHNEEVRRLI